MKKQLHKPRIAWQSEDKESHLYQGDTLEWLTTLEPDSVDCIWTDRPYLLSNDGITCVAGKMVKVNKGEWDRSRGIELDHQFNRTWLTECLRILKPSGSIWVSGTLHVYLSVGMAMQELGFRILNDIVWEKPAPPPNLGCRCFTHASELILWATKAKKGGKDRHIFNYQAMKDENGGKQMKSIWRLSTPSAEEKKYGKHPTQKPLALISRCLRASTNPGNIVLDPFAGSSSTGVAAISLGREFIGCEQDAKFVRISKARLSETIPRSQQEKASAETAKARQTPLFKSA